MPVERVAVVGCGTIGTGWAIFFRARGLEVRVWDPAADHADRIERAVEDGEADLRTLGLMAQPPGRIVFCARAEEAVEGASFVQESAPEQLELKRTLYRRIAPALPPDALLASSTSFLQPSALQEDLPFAERLVVGHPFNPPHLIPLVEVVGGRWTAPGTVDRALAFYAGLGKRAIRLNHEAPGHLANRLQAALWREAVHAVESGLATVADVDAAIAHGPGLRWALMGPHLTFHLAGGEGGMAHFLDHLGDANEAMWRQLGTPGLTPRTRTALIEGCAREAEGHTVGELRRRRDAQLVALLASSRRIT